MKRFIFTIFLLIMSFGSIRSFNKDFNYLIKPTEKSLLKLPLNIDTLRTALSVYNITNRNIVLSQAILETGSFKSKNCIYKNNLFGLYNSEKNKMHSFKHWSLSVKAYKQYIQYKHKPGEDYYKFLKRIGYASDPLYINKLHKIKKQL